MYTFTAITCVTGATGAAESGMNASLATIPFHTGCYLTTGFMNKSTLPTGFIRWHATLNFQGQQPGIQADNTLCLCKLLAYSPFWESQTVHYP